jgi:hypothetical protein
MVTPCCEAGKSTIDVGQEARRKRTVPALTTSANTIVNIEPMKCLSKRMLSGHGGVKTHPLFVPAEQKQI